MSAGFLQQPNDKPRAIPFNNTPGEQGEGEMVNISEDCEEWLT